VGDFRELVLHLGGRVIALDGQNDQRINVLQVLKTGDEDSISYNRHFSKVSTFYRYLKPEAELNEILVMENLLRELYMQCGLVNADDSRHTGITNRPPEEYPILSDYLVLLSEKLKEYKATGLSSELEYMYMKSIELTISNLVLNFGNIFDGKTSIPDIYAEQIISFDFSNLVSMKPEIFDAQYFIVQTLSWDNCIEAGMSQKTGFDKREIDKKDITMFWVIMDELHRTVNANKTVGIELLSQFEREARKYFGGLWFATQNLRDLVPENAQSKNADQIKNLFDLTTYKFVMQQDANSKGLIATVFGSQFTQYEIDSIPVLEKGQAIISLSGEGNILLNIDVSEEELRIFAGGA
jgi:hypothetical protein